MPDLPDSDQKPGEPSPTETTVPEETPVSEETTPLGETPLSSPLAAPDQPSEPDLPATGAVPEEPVVAPAEETPMPTLEVTPSLIPPEGVTPSLEAETPLSEEVQPEISPPVSEVGPPPAEIPPPTPPPSEPQPEAGPPLAEAETFHVEKRSPFDLIKKILPLILIILIILGAAFVVYRFVLPLVRQPEEVTLTYWGLWESSSVMNEVLADWEREHPKIKVSYAQQSSEEYRERLQSALARGEGPDIFRFHNAWVPMLKNELEPVPATVMDAATYEDTFYPVAVSSLRSGATYMGIPLEIDTLALFYNQDIFTAAAVEPPQTWDELRQLASQLTLRDDEGRIQRAGVALGTTSNIWHWSDILGLMMLQNGADLANPLGALAEDALSFYTIFSKTDRVWDETLPSSLMAFATGKTAMFFGYSWDVFEIKNANPNLDFRITTAPQLPGTDIAWASFWVEGVSKKSQNKAAAWEFLKFLSSKETMQELYQAESRVRLFGEPYSRTEMASTLQADPMVAPFINQAPKAETWYLCSRTFDNGINDKMIQYFEDAVNAVNAGENLEGALETAASGVAQILAQYGLGAYTAR